jgi:type III secretion protein J
MNGALKPEAARRSAIRRPPRCLAVFAMAFFMLLAGCGSHVELVSALPESEANEVLGTLLNAGIDARKQLVKNGTSVIIEQSAVARAIDILQQHGLPRERRARMGDVFKKENMVSSPLEERARYLYALSQELEQTFSQIDGIVTARVHIVLPERAGPGDPLVPSSASVFLKYRKGFGADNTVPQVRLLVANSIPGLTQDKVAVALVPAVVVSQAPATRVEDVWFFRVEPGSSTSLRIFILTLVGAVVLLGAGLAYVLSKGEGLGQFGRGFALPWRKGGQA